MKDRSYFAGTDDPGVEMLMTKKQTKVEIWVMANGFMVTPSVNPNAYVPTLSETYVFETLEALYAWMKTNLQEPRPA